MAYQKREGAWKYNYPHKPTTRQALELAAAFVGMHTTGGVPKEYLGKFDCLLEDPNMTLRVIMGAIESMKGK